jgi:redox-sensitive bicupin YhaK (pirin superfamily)
MSVIQDWIRPRPRDLGGFSVARVLPARQRQMVGPFIFFDHMGPATFAAGQGVDVRPHPHIGLATVTYLFEGALLHRDNLGYAQEIRPGDVNWMTAGRGIVHSERSPPGARVGAHRVHGIQTWVALPRRHELAEPAFEHTPAAALPAAERSGVRIRIVAGEAFGMRSPVRTLSPTLYVVAELAAGATLDVPADAAPERAVYAVDAAAVVGDETLGPQELAVLMPDRAVPVRARGETRLVLIGGEPVDGPRLIWWNLVASDEQYMEAARRAWRDGDTTVFPPVPGDPERIPLPEY